MRVLITDDETRFLKVLKRSLESEGYADVRTASSGAEALEALREQGADVLVTDLKMPGMSGLELMGEARRRQPGLEVILMTAYAEVQTAREALKRGAVDYLVKPFDDRELFDLLDRVKASRLEAGAADPGEVKKVFGMVGVSAQMKKVFSQLEKFGSTDAPVLILGESGTGKELVARAIHRLSRRNSGPFVEIHSAAIPETLLESELFGHEKGAFTGADKRKTGQFEAASGGTVFLDEIGEMPASLQPKLLRFLQEHNFYRVGGTEVITVDARVIAATNRDLESEVRKGAFREDLFYRLDVLNIRIPALRERKADIEPLVSNFLESSGRNVSELGEEVFEILKAYDWPGNIRELENVIKRITITAGEDRIKKHHLPEKLLTFAPETGKADEAGMDLVENEKELIEQALSKSGGNKTRAAEMLGISRRRLYSRMKSLGMDRS